MLDLLMLMVRRLVYDFPHLWLKILCEKNENEKRGEKIQFYMPFHPPKVAFFSLLLLFYVQKFTMTSCMNLLKKNTFMSNKRFIENILLFFSAQQWWKHSLLSDEIKMPKMQLCYWINWWKHKMGFHCEKWGFKRTLFYCCEPAVLKKALIYIAMSILQFFGFMLASENQIGSLVSNFLSFFSMKFI